MFEEILQKLKLQLEANVLIEHTQDWEDIQTDADPWAIIVPSDNESEYNTTEENARVYAFKIMLFVSRTVRAKSAADRVMRVLVDSVIDDIDKDYAFIDAGVPTKTGYTFLANYAAPSTWGYAMPEDEYRVATINVRALVSVDLNSIS